MEPACGLKPLACLALMVGEDQQQQRSSISGISGAPAPGELR